MVVHDIMTLGRRRNPGRRRHVDDYDYYKTGKNRDLKEIREEDVILITIIINSLCMFSCLEEVLVTASMVTFMSFSISLEAQTEKLRGDRTYAEKKYKFAI